MVLASLDLHLLGEFATREIARFFTHSASVSHLPSGGTTPAWSHHSASSLLALHPKTARSTSSSCRIEVKLDASSLDGHPVIEKNLSLIRALSYPNWQNFPVEQYLYQAIF
jgi:hypothetical protein